MFDKPPPPVLQNVSLTQQMLKTRGRNIVYEEDSKKGKENKLKSILGGIGIKGKYNPSDELNHPFSLLSVKQEEEFQHYYANIDLSPTSYCGATRMLNRKPYDRDSYLAGCKMRAQSGTKEKIRFIITNVETHYAPKTISNLYNNIYSSFKKGDTLKEPSYLKNHYLTTVGAIFKKNNDSQNGNGNGNGANYTQYKDVIFLRGKTIPTKPGEISKTVMSYIKYNIPNYGPRFYIEAREGFESASYKESLETLFLLPHECHVSEMDNSNANGVAKFVRWIQNYMYTKKMIKKNGKCKNPDNDDFSRDIKTNNIVNPNDILAYVDFYNTPGFKSLWGRIPEPEENGPDRHIIEVIFYFN